MRPFRSRPPGAAEPLEAVLRSFGYFERANRRACRGAIRPGIGGAESAGLRRGLAMFSILRTHEYGQAFTFSRIP